MGFFTDLRDDLSQAVNELMPAEAGTPGEHADQVDSEGQSAGVDSGESSNIPNIEENFTPGPDMPEKRMSDEVAVITAGMTIKGDITSEGSMELVGTVAGNINLLGKLNVTGCIQGDSKAAEVYAENARITGEINSFGNVKIGQSSVIIGNVFAANAVIAGAVKGDIDVRGSVVLDSSAIVMGNIKSKSVQINNGAVIEGMCSQCYADVNPVAFFEEVSKGNR